MNALIIVDMQYDFLPGGALAVQGGDEIIPQINNLQNSFDLVIATQDWHPKHHKSFASNHSGKKPFDQITLNGLPQVLWPDHCVQGSRGAAFSELLNMNLVEAVFRKGMDPGIDSYSAFYDNGHKKSTGLTGYLKERQVQKIFVCGLAADYCVYFTAKDGLREEFKTYIIEDATCAIDNNNLGKVKQQFVVDGGIVVSSQALHQHL